MVLIIGGLFIGLVAVVGHAQLGWFLVVPLLGAVLMVLAGFGNLRNGRPEATLEALNKWQREHPMAENREAARQDPPKAHREEPGPGPDTTP
jgi:hypothetical protein